jgi:hypothetical protein
MTYLTFTRSTLFFIILLAAFVLPGYTWVTWVHRSDSLTRTNRLALAFAWSFALFSLVSAPFLWWHGSIQSCLYTLLPVWTVYCLSGAALYAAWKRSVPVTAPPSAPEPPSPVGARKRAGATSQRAPIWVFLALGFYLAVIALVVLSRGYLPESHGYIIRGIIPLLALLAVLIWLIGPTLRPLIEFTSEDNAPAPRMWNLVALLFIVFQAVGVTIYDRPDWDDCFSLGAALDYSHATMLSDQEPTFREGFAMPATHILMCWELWGAILSRLSGANILTTFHTLLPAPMVFLVYAAYAMLLGQLLPRRWVPLALIGLSAYHLWGIGSNWSPANHFLIRSWQGKAILLHGAIPLVVLCVTRFAEKPSWQWWLSLSACVLFALGVSSSAIFMVVILVAGLAVVLLPTVPTKKLLFGIGAAVSLTPLAVEFYGIQTVAPVGQIIQGSKAPEGYQDPIKLANKDSAASTSSGGRPSWLGQLNLQTDSTGAEMIWVLSLPLTALLLKERRRRTYLIFFPALLFATAANPFLYDIVIAYIMPQIVYYRILWLFPVGVGLAALLALLSRLTARILAGRLPIGESYFPLTVALVGTVLYALLPGYWVWSTQNELGPYMTPHLAANPEKTPPDLLAIAQLILDDPHVTDGRILCHEDTASFLRPCSRDFRFVLTRPMYLNNFVTVRPREAVERFFLSVVIDAGRFGPALEDRDWEYLRTKVGDFTVANWRHSAPTLQEVPNLLKKLRVRYIVAGPMLDASDELLREKMFEQREQLLLENGYREVYQGREYSLWMREGR